MELFHAWEPIIRKYESNPHTEIEIRLGKINRTSFDTDLTKDTYEKILRRLQRYKEWESVTEYDTTVFYFQNGGRVTYDNVLDQEIESVIKKPLEKVNFSLQKQPFDVRLGVSTEIPFERDEDEQAVSSRTKKRMSFLRKNLKIDVTAVTGDPDDPDSESETQYQVELEFVKVPESRDELYNMVLKVFDVLKISR